MAFALFAFIWMAILFCAMAAAERYIPDSIMDKLDRLLGFSEEVSDDE